MHVVVEIKVFDVFGQRPKVSIMKILCNLRDEKGWENGSLVLQKRIFVTKYENHLNQWLSINPIRTPRACIFPKFKKLFDRIPSNMNLGFY